MYAAVYSRTSFLYCVSALPGELDFELLSDESDDDSELFENEQAWDPMRTRASRTAMPGRREESFHLSHMSFDLTIGVNDVARFYSGRCRATTGKRSEAAKTVNHPALALRGSPETARADHRRQDASLPGRWGRREVLVEARRLRTGASMLGERGHPHELLPARKGDAQEVAGANGACRLGRLLVEINLPAVARRRGQRAAFEEAGRPQPLVHAHVGHDALTVAQPLGYTRRRMPGAIAWQRSRTVRES